MAEVADGVHQPGQRQLPAGPLLAHLTGGGQAASQAVADGGGSGEQRERPGRAVSVAGPQDLAPGGLQRQHEVERPLHHRPHLGQEPGVAEAQPVMPDTRRDIGDRVGVELVLVDAVGGVVLVPGSVGPAGCGPATRRPRRPPLGARRRSGPWQPLRGSRDRTPPPAKRGIMPLDSWRAAIVSAVRSASARDSSGDHLRCLRCGPARLAGCGGPSRWSSAAAKLPTWFRRHGPCPRSGGPARRSRRVEAACRRTRRGSSPVADSAVSPRPR